VQVWRRCNVTQSLIIYNSRRRMNYLILSLCRISYFSMDTFWTEPSQKIIRCSSISFVSTGRCSWCTSFCLCYHLFIYYSQIGRIINAIWLLFTALYTKRGHVHSQRIKNFYFLHEWSDNPWIEINWGKRFIIFVNNKRVSLPKDLHRNLHL
jgi:hypothetical protein